MEVQLPEDVWLYIFARVPSICILTHLIRVSRAWKNLALSSRFLDLRFPRLLSVIPSNNQHTDAEYQQLQLKLLRSRLRSIVPKQISGALPDISQAMRYSTNLNRGLVKAEKFQPLAHEAVARCTGVTSRTIAWEAPGATMCLHDFQSKATSRAYGVSDTGAYGFSCHAPEHHLVVRREPQNIPVQSIRCISTLSNREVWSYTSTFVRPDCLCPWSASPHVDRQKILAEITCLDSTLAYISIGPTRAHFCGIDLLPPQLIDSDSRVHQSDWKSIKLLSESWEVVIDLEGQPPAYACFCADLHNNLVFALVGVLPVKGDVRHSYLSAIDWRTRQILRTTRLENSSSPSLTVLHHPYQEYRSLVCIGNTTFTNGESLRIIDPLTGETLLGAFGRQVSDPPPPYRHVIFGKQASLLASPSVLDPYNGASETPRLPKAYGVWIVDEQTLFVRCFNFLTGQLYWQMPLEDASNDGYKMSVTICTPTELITGTLKTPRGPQLRAFDLDTGMERWSVVLEHSMKFYESDAVFVLPDGQTFAINRTQVFLLSNH